MSPTTIDPYQNNTIAKANLMWFPTTNWYQEEIKVDEEITESKHFNNSMVTIKEQFIKFIEDLRKLSQQQQEIEFLVARGNNWVQYGRHIK